MAVPVPSRHDAVLPWVTALRRINRQASVVICFPNEQRFEVLSGHFRPDRRGLIPCVITGLRFFGLPNAVPPDPPCGEVCPVARPGEANSFSMFHNNPQ